MENCSKANEKRCTMPYSMSLYRPNVGVVTLFISAIINRGVSDVGFPIFADADTDADFAF